MYESISPERPPTDLSIPFAPDLDAIYSDYLNSGSAESFSLPEPPINPHEGDIVIASKTDGKAIEWVQLLLEKGNPEAAAYVALENLEVFGEPQGSPQDSWQTERTSDRDGLKPAKPGTHPLLNALRRALLSRMTDRKVVPQSRLRCGELLGSLGGDPRFEICGKALILKEEYWQWVGEPQRNFEFLMGDMEVPFSWTGGRELLNLSIPSFKMAGLLVTNAQYLCFADSEDFLSPNWWPYGWLPGNEREGDDDRFSPIPWSLRRNRGGVEPVRCNYLQAYAYALWERAQRLGGAVRGTRIELSLPSDAQLEAAFRSHPSNDPTAESAADGRWRFPYTPGIREARTQRFQDVRPWHFNHNEIIGMRASPVGMWPESAVGQLQDLSGNLWSWTTSLHTEYLEEDASTGRRQPDKEDRFCQVAARGGCYDCSASRCSSGSRGEGLVLSIDPDFGFRLVINDLMPIDQGCKSSEDVGELLGGAPNDVNLIAFFSKINDDWFAAAKKGIRMVPNELASIASCENCSHCLGKEYFCNAHQQSVNKDAWTCDQFDRSFYSKEVGGIYDGAPWSYPLSFGYYIDSAPIAVDGALVGDADCCFVVACLLCDPVMRAMISVMLVPEEPVREDTHVIFDELFNSKVEDPAALKANDPRKWFHKAANEYLQLTPGAKMAQRVLGDTDSDKQKIKNIIDCKKYMNSIVENSDYFRKLTDV